MLPSTNPVVTNTYFTFFTKTTSTDYMAIFRVAVPAVVGMLLKLVNHSDTAGTYKNDDRCIEGYSNPLLQTVNSIDNTLIQNVGLLAPEALTLLISTVIASFILASGKDTMGEYLSNAAKKMMSQVKSFGLDLTKQEIIYAVGLVATAFATEMAEVSLKNSTGFDVSGHFETAVTYELLNSFTLRVISRMEANEAEKRNGEVATVSIWLSAFLASIMLTQTARECHTVAEVAAGFGVGISLAVINYFLAPVLASGIDYVKEACKKEDNDEAMRESLLAI